MKVCCWLIGFPYLWEDENPSTFRWWAPGEPNDSDGTNNCGRMYLFLPTENRGRWDDYLCNANHEHGYACKTPIGIYVLYKVFKIPVLSVIRHLKL